MILTKFIYLFIFIEFSFQLNNGVGKTPQMGKREEKQKKRNFIYL